jgi:hypothetical protein
VAQLLSNQDAQPELLVVQALTKRSKVEDVLKSPHFTAAMHIMAGDFLPELLKSNPCLTVKAILRLYADNNRGTDDDKDGLVFDIAHKLVDMYKDNKLRDVSFGDIRHLAELLIGDDSDDMYDVGLVDWSLQASESRGEILARLENLSAPEEQNRYLARHSYRSRELSPETVGDGVVVADFDSLVEWALSDPSLYVSFGVNLPSVISQIEVFLHDMKRHKFQVEVLVMRMLRATWSAAAYPKATALLCRELLLQHLERLRDRGEVVLHTFTSPADESFKEWQQRRSVTLLVNPEGPGCVLATIHLSQGNEVFRMKNMSFRGGNFRADRLENVRNLRSGEAVARCMGLSRDVLDSLVQRPGLLR